MCEEEMDFVELLSETIMYKIEFKNKKEIENFCNELKITLLDFHDPDFIYSSSESESSEDDVEPETIEVAIDNDGFMEIVL